MFKKLKDKIAEEVKSSPQRIQQLTQSVVQNISSNDGNLFSIADEDIPKNDSQASFTEVSLNNTSTPVTNSYAKQRRNSNSSIASDVSFLPRYESPSNQYHLQSDLDMSVSEMEEDTTSVSKEQIYEAFRKAQVRYHKYRGRYTDLSNHYRELERENAKMKQVLGETQDKALRRVSELKEQCNLEKSAKAHLENALRVEMDEKQYIIDSLKQKLQILDTSGKLNESDSAVDGGQMDTLVKDLEDARIEIESLNEKLGSTQKARINEKQELETALNELRIKVGTKNESEDNEELKKSLDMKAIELEAKEMAENSLKSKISELERLLEAKNSENAEKQREYEDNSRKAIEEHRKSIEKMQSEHTDKLKELQNTLRTKEGEWEKTRKCLETKNGEIQEKLAKSIAETHQAVEKVQKENLDKVADLKQALERKNLDFEAFRNELEAKCSDLTSRNAELEHNLASKIEENQQIIKKLEEDHKQSVETLQGNLKASQEEVERLQSSLNEVNEQEQENSLILAQNKQDLHVELSEAHKRTEELKREVAEALAERQNLTEELAKVRQETKQGIINLQEKMTEKEEEWKAEREKLVSTETAPLRANLEKAQQKLQTLESDLKDRNDFIELLEKENATAKEENGNSKRKLSELESLLRDSKENSSEVIKNYQLQIENFKRENNDQKSSIEAVKQHLQGLEDKLRSSSQRVIDLESELANVTDEKEKSEQKVAKQGQKLQVMETERQNDIDRLMREIVFLKVNQTELEATLKDLNREKQDLVGDFDRTKREYSTTLNEREEKVQRLEDENRELDRKLAELVMERGKIENELKVVQEELETLRVRLASEGKINEDTAEQLKATKVALQELKDEKEGLRKELDVFKNQESADVNAIREKYETQLKTLTEMHESQGKKSEESESQLQQVRSDLEAFGEEKQSLQREIEHLNASKVESEAERKVLEEKLSRLEERQENVLRENEHLRQDYENLTVENDSLKDFQRRFQSVSEEKLSLESKINSLREDYNNTVKSSRENYEAVQNETSELNKRLEIAIGEVTEHKKRLHDAEEQLEGKKQELTERAETIERLERQFREQNETETVKQMLQEISQLKSQLGHAEHQLMELVNEKQLLQDELNELKISPISKSNDAFTLEAMPNGQSLEALQSQHQKTLSEFKTMEETNKSTISFYETQVEKLKNKNEKLVRKLDETLVTLNHFSDLNGSTEIEYLRNVLYNYMLGKESLVLARVIAAVCKFDPVQTETVLQKEQQKQTLLGQLGIL